MPPSLTDHTACPGLELLSCELLANPAVVADVQILKMYTKHRHELYHERKAWFNTLVRPLLTLVTLIDESSSHMQVSLFVYLNSFVHVPREYGKYIYIIRLNFLQIVTR